MLTQVSAALTCKLRHICVVSRHSPLLSRHDSFIALTCHAVSSCSLHRLQLLPPILKNPLCMHCALHMLTAEAILDEMLFYHAGF